MNIPQFAPSQNDMLYNDQLSQALVAGLSDSGWTSPTQTTDQIVEHSTNMPDGTFWTNTTTNQVIFKMPDGNLYSVNMTPFTP